MLEVIRNSGYSYLLSSVHHLEQDPGDIDIIDANHAEVFDGRISSVSPLYQRGNILVSVKHMNAIFIIESGTREIAWLWGPSNLALQHHPAVPENGNILLFDNGLKRSRVIEIEVPPGRVVWTYADGDDFFSEWGGSVQRLANGNTLITETARGYATEVTREGEFAWHFANPLVNQQDGTRLNIWRTTRFSESNLPFLRKGQ